MQTASTWHKGSWEMTAAEHTVPPEWSQPISRNGGGKMEETQEGSNLFSIALNTVNKKHLCFYVIPPLSIYSQQKERGDSVWSEESGKEENERKH